MAKKWIREYGMITLGAVSIALGTNLFQVPLGLYNGGFVGLAQLLRTLLMELTGWNVLYAYDVSGVIYFIINIPLFLLGFQKLGKSFFIKSVCSVIMQSLFLSLIQIPNFKLVDDMLTGSIIAALLVGWGSALTLRAGGSGGGVELAGVYLIRIFSNFRVGIVSLVLNTFIFGVCAVLYDPKIAIYGLAYTYVFSIVVDRFYYQNIRTSAMIFTKRRGYIQKAITDQMHRGVTYWNGYGGFTDQSCDVLMTVISKHEISQLKKIILKIDPQAFLIVNEGLNIEGNFEKRI